MARYLNRMTVTAKPIRDFANGLRMIADTFDQQAELMERTGLESVEASHWKTAATAAELISRFAGAIQRAVIKAKMQADLDGIQKAGQPEKSTRKRES